MRQESTIRKQLEDLIRQHRSYVSRHGKEVWWSERPAKIEILKWVLGAKSPKSKDRETK